MQEAIEQLAVAGRPENPRITHGLVALDVTWLGNPTGGVAIVGRMDDGADAADPLVRRVASQIEGEGLMDRLLERRNPRLCVGVVLFGAITVFGRDGGLGNSCSFRVLHRGAEYMEALDVLMARLTAQ
jgi:hypothetical protein